MFDRRLVLLASPRQIGLLDWRPGRMHWLGSFAADTQGIAAFQSAIRHCARCPALLVVDTVDEDYRSEILPHVQGRGRHELLSRKLRQVFRNARFTGTVRQGREPSGRRDDRYLFVALTDADWLAPWLAVIDAARVPLAAIVPLALACQPLLDALRVREAHTLLAYQLDGRLRLSYYASGQLRFSRLIGGDAASSLPGNTADEVAKTQLYLMGQRILPREARLHIVLIDPQGAFGATQAALNADPAFTTRQVTLATLASSLRIPQEFLAATPELAPLAAYASAPPSLNLAPPALLQRYTEFRWRRGLQLTATLVAASGIVISSALGLQAQNRLNEAGILEAQTRQIDTRHAAIVNHFPALATRPADLERTIQLAERLKNAPLALDRLFPTLGQALTAHPDIMLKSLAFEPQSDGLTHVTLDARLAHFDGNFRVTMARIDSLTRHLTAIPGVRSVIPLVSPVDIAPTATLRGETLHAARPDATRFKLGIEIGP